MATSQSGALKRRATGGRRRTYRDKRKFELGSLPTHPVISKEKDVRKNVNVQGTGKKTKIKRALYVNVLDKSTGKHQKTKLLTEKENPANRNYARQNIITKGAVITTEIGDVRITSRPGQSGSLNAVLIEKKK
ncbi:30S ribosomal protein S8e [Candidatus Micrarchaeota archaeon]|nr:30S ribosomal protein S8e [Candidatus Micrarchaeota archaeon]